MTIASPQRLRAYSAAHFVLELGNEQVGFCRSVEGGGMNAEILTYNQGGNTQLLRQLAKPKIDDLKLQVGFSMSQVFCDWIMSFVSGTVVRHNGAISVGNFNYQECARTEFKEALIRELGFPKLDASDKNPCYMNITIAPEILEHVRGEETQLPSESGGVGQKLWTAANFELVLDNFPDACRRVTKVEAFTIKQKILEYPSGGRRTPIRVPGILEFPSITFSVPEVDAHPMIEHFREHVVGGTPQARGTGSLALRDHVGEDLCTISLKGVDIAKVTPDKSDATSEDIKQVQIEISVEEMLFKYE